MFLKFLRLDTYTQAKAIILNSFHSIFIFTSLYLMYKIPYTYSRHPTLSTQYILYTHFLSSVKIKQKKNIFFISSIKRKTLKFIFLFILFQKHRDENLERNNNTNNINDNNSRKHIKCDEKLCFLRLKIGLHNINDKKHHYDTSEHHLQWSTNFLRKKKRKCNVFKFMKDLLKRKLANSEEEARYIEVIIM